MYTHAPAAVGVRRGFRAKKGPTPEERGFSTCPGSIPSILQAGGADRVQTLVVRDRGLSIVRCGARRLRGAIFTELSGQGYTGCDSGDRDEADTENAYGGLRRWGGSDRGKILLQVSAESMPCISTTFSVIGDSTIAQSDLRRNGLMPQERYVDAEGSFSLTVPIGWEPEKDPEGGLLLHSPEGSGLLHLIPFARDVDEEIDPGEELYAFLADQEIELEEEEVEDVPLSAGSMLALCEYAAVEEDEEVEEEGGHVHWIVGVAAAPGQLVFASYSCAAGEEAEGTVVREILNSLVLEGNAGTPRE